jgi:hypothetical protein
MFLYFLSTGRIQASAEQVPSQDTGEVEDHAQGKILMSSFADRATKNGQV